MRYLFIFCYRSVSELGYNECTMIFLNNSSLFFISPLNLLLLNLSYRYNLV